jgi:hypothetical protein
MSEVSQRSEGRVASVRQVVLLMMLTGLLAACATTPALPPVTTEQILQMSREGVPAADIIQKMRDAGTVYRLSGSQLAQLKSQGVADEVLDYMQDTYLAQERARGAQYGYYWGSPYGWGPYPYSYWGPPGYWWPYWGYYPYPVPPPNRPPRRPSAPPSSSPPTPPASPNVPPSPPPRRGGVDAPTQQRN